MTIYAGDLGLILPPLVPRKQKDRPTIKVVAKKQAKAFSLTVSITGMTAADKQRAERAVASLKQTFRYQARFESS